MISVILLAAACSSSPAPVTTPFPGAIVYRRQLPTSANSPIAVFGNTVLVPAGGPATSSKGGGGNPQLVAYAIP